MGVVKVLLPTWSITSCSRVIPNPCSSPLSLVSLVTSEDTEVTFTMPRHLRVLVLRFLRILGSSVPPSQSPGGK